MDNPFFIIDLFRNAGYISINSDCGNPFAQGYEVIHLIDDVYSEHILSRGCRCGPELTEDSTTGSEFWMHHTFH